MKESIDTEGKCKCKERGGEKKLSSGGVNSLCGVCM